MFWEISASRGSERCSFLFPVQGDFPNPWNEHLCRGWTPQMTHNRIYTQKHTQTLDKHNALGVYARALCGQDNFLSFVELSQFDTYQKLVFSSIHARSCVLCFCEQLMLTKIIVSRNETWTKFEFELLALLSAKCQHRVFFSSLPIVSLNFNCPVAMGLRKSQGDKTKL